MPFTIIRQDITKVEADAIVNPTNENLLRGKGACGAIFDAAGIDELTKACKDLAPIKTGEAVITPGFKLPAKFIIHTAGPVYEDGKHDEEKLLRSCYKKSLALALKNGCESVAFPLISSGIFGYPKAYALDIAVTEIRKFVEKHNMEVTLVVFDEKSFDATKVLADIDSYIDNDYAKANNIRRTTIANKNLTTIGTGHIKSRLSSSAILNMQIKEHPATFSEKLVELVEEKSNGKPSKIYKKGNLGKDVYYKINKNAKHHPTKETVLAFAVALELNIEETDDLLCRAGYSLSPCIPFDIIVQHFIVHKVYNVYKINLVLFKYGYDGKQLLGGSMK